MKSLLAIVMLLFFPGKNNAQDSLLSLLIKQNELSFRTNGSSFSGEGWNKIDSAVKASKYVLIGEDHFFNEVPQFVSVIASIKKFDNFFVEIDPYSAALLQQKIKNTSSFPAWKKEFQKTFSFFSLPKEMELMQQMVKGGSKVAGTDQVLLVADRLLCSELKKITKNPQAVKLYEKIETNSKIYFDSFLVNPAKPFYMLTPEFDSCIRTLLSLNITAGEKEQLKAIQLSRRIYMEQNHFLRLQLMKNNFYTYYYPLLNNKTSLFKFGSVHMTKGEGLLGGYDIGNIVYNIADSRYEKSLHISIIGKNGMQGSPFKGFPAQALDPENGELKSLAPFFKEVNDTEWKCFNLLPLQKAIQKNELTIKDKLLSRMIMGYDYLVIIPNVTADSF